MPVRRFDSAPDPPGLRCSIAAAATMLNQNHCNLGGFGTRAHENGARAEGLCSFRIDDGHRPAMGQLRLGTMSSTRPVFLVTMYAVRMHS